MSETRGAPEFVWTEAVEDEIFARIMEGESVRSITAAGREERFPSAPTFYKRMASDPVFAKRYAHAKDILADNEFDEIREIADNSSNDWMENNDPDNPGYRLNGDHVQRSRLRVDVRKWRAARLAPKKYGDKIDLTHANPDGSPLSLVAQIMGQPIEPVDDPPEE